MGSYAELGTPARKIGGKLENEFNFHFSSFFPLRGWQAKTKGPPTTPEGQLFLG